MHILLSPAVQRLPVYFMTRNIVWFKNFQNAEMKKMSYVTFRSLPMIVFLKSVMM